MVLTQLVHYYVCWSIDLCINILLNTFDNQIIWGDHMCYAEKSFPLLNCMSYLHMRQIFAFSKTAKLYFQQV